MTTASTPDPTGSAGQPSDRVESAVRDALARHGKMGVDARTVDARADLFQHGLTSNASVNVMLAVEDALEVEFPDADLTRATFTSVASLTAVAARLVEA